MVAGLPVSSAIGGGGKEGTGAGKRSFSGLHNPGEGWRRRCLLVLAQLAPRSNYASQLAMGELCGSQVEPAENRWCVRRGQRRT